MLLAKAQAASPATSPVKVGIDRLRKAISFPKNFGVASPPPASPPR